MLGWIFTTVPSSSLLDSWTACGCRSLGNDWSLTDAVSLSYELQSEAGCSRHGGCTPSYAWSGCDEGLMVFLQAPFSMTLLMDSAGDML